MSDAPLVLVVDDDSSIRKALTRLLTSAGMRTETFASPAEFLQYRQTDVPSCLVLDVKLPEIDGLELQRKLSLMDLPLPIVFITGHGDIPMSVRAIKSGAVDFLSKPFNDEDLLSAVRQALSQSQRELRARSDNSLLRERLKLLSPREREVLAHVVSGELNKQIGRRLGVTEKTVKVHRGQVMRKMEAESLADLVRMAQKLGISGPSETNADVDSRAVVT